MNILFLCEKKDGSDGWSRYSQSLIEVLAKRRHMCTTCNVARDTFHVCLPPPLLLLTRPFLAPIFAWKIWHYCRKNIIDVVHITVEPYALIVPFLPKYIQRTVVLTLHGSYAIRPLLMWQTRWLAYKYYKRIPRFIAVSHYTKKRVIEHLEKMGKEKIAKHVEQHTTVIHNGIKIREQRTENREQTVDQTKQILHVGGIKPIKGVLEALAACAIYRDKYDKNFHLSIIGRYDSNDRYVQRVRSRIVDLNLDRHVTLRGFVSEPELQKAYQKADLLLLPSRTFQNTFEGFGLVFLEANAYGIPVIGPKTSGAAEAIKEGVNGFHVDPEQPVQIAERIHWILNEHRIEPTKCQEWAKKHTIEHTAAQVEHIYQSIQP